MCLYVYVSADLAINFAIITPYHAKIKSGHWIFSYAFVVRAMQFAEEQRD